MPDFDTEYLARCLDKFDVDGLHAFIESLKKDPEAPAILERLAHDRRADVRSWAAAVAQETRERAALPWLLEMAQRDRDNVNRSSALQAIEAIDPEAVRPLIPRLLAKLRKGDPVYAIEAARALARIGYKEAVPEMRAVAERWEPGIYYRKQLEAWILALDGRTDEIYERIKAHDHICMGWLAYAAEAFVRTPEARAVLEWGAQNLPDEQCRRTCAESVRDGRWLPELSS